MPESKLEKDIKANSVLKQLIRVFRTNSVVKHHFQTSGNTTPQGVAKAFFKNVYNFKQSAVPGYSGYDRFARYSDYAEAESNPIVGNALNIFTDEVTQKNEHGKIIEVTSEDETIQETLEDLFSHILK